MHKAFFWIDLWVPFLADGGSLVTAKFLLLGCLISLEEVLKLLLLIPKLLLSGFKLPLSFIVGLLLKSFSRSFLPTFSNVLALVFWEIACACWGFADFMYWSVKFFAGGHAKVLLGIVFGIGSLIKGSHRIYSKVGLFEASKTSIFEIKFLALSDIVTWSGNE